MQLLGTYRPKSNGPSNFHMTIPKDWVIAAGVSLDTPLTMFEDRQGNLVVVSPMNMLSGKIELPKGVD